MSKSIKSYNQIEVEVVGEEVGGCEREAFVTSPKAGEEPGGKDGPGPMVLIWSLVD